MSSSHQMLLGSGGGIQAVSGANFSGVQMSAVGANVAYNASFGNSGLFNGNGGPANWYNPTTVGIGTLFWARFTRSAGNAFTTGSEGVWVALNGGYTVGWTATTLFRSWTGTVEFASDAAGTIPAGTNTLSLTLDRI